MSSTISIEIPRKVIHAARMTPQELLDLGHPRREVRGNGRPPLPVGGGNPLLRNSLFVVLVLLQALELRRCPLFTFGDE